jgi:hypothetical protein
MFKDQMEVSAAHVATWSALLDVDQTEIALRCGISTPVQPRQTDVQRITGLEARVCQLEEQLALLLKQQGATS